MLLLQVYTVTMCFGTRPLTLAGLTDTPMVQSPNFNQELLGKLKLSLPMNRMVYPTDITDTILFLLSDAASFISGQVHSVNGGSS
jgi:NAD(P)-dependent dehydrogenase (short-subunit alcohol dehydrogenase family)